MSEKSEEPQSTPGKKPDGSTYKAHMDALTKRNEQAHAAGRKRREQHETDQATARRVEEARQTKDLNSGHAPRGKSQQR